MKRMTVAEACKLIEAASTEYMQIRIYSLDGGKAYIPIEKYSLIAALKVLPSTDIINAQASETGHQVCIEGC